VQLHTKSSELTYPSQQLGALREKRKGAIAQGVQIIDSRRLPLFICTESAEEPSNRGQRAEGRTRPPSPTDVSFDSNRGQTSSRTSSVI